MFKSSLYIILHKPFPWSFSSVFFHVSPFPAHETCFCAYSIEASVSKDNPHHVIYAMFDLFSLHSLIFSVKCPS